MTSAGDRRRHQLPRYNDVTDGSRTTFATGMATILAARDAIKKLTARAAQIWASRRKR